MLPDGGSYDRPNQNSSAAIVMYAVSGATSESDSTRSNRYRIDALRHTLSFRRMVIRTSMMLIVTLYHRLVLKGCA